MNVRQILTAGGVAALLAFTGCGRGNSVEVNPNQKTPDQIIAPEKHAVTITVVDAATGNLVSTPVALEIKGALAGKATDAFGKPISRLSTNAGIAAFYMNASGTLNVVATAEGYFAGGVSFEVKQTLVIARVHLVNLSAPPAGVKVSLGTQTAENGRLKDSLRVIAPDGSVISFPKSVLLRAKDSALLNGTLQLQLLTYDIDSASVLAALPGGNTALFGNKDIPLQYFGVLGVSLKDSTGREVAFLDSSFLFTIPVPRSLVNPLTGKVFAVGDSLDVVSLSADSARWVYESGAAVSRLGSSLVVQFRAKHLSYWGLRVRQKPAGQNTCAPVVFKLPGMSGINVELNLFKSGFYSYGYTGGDTIRSLNTLPEQELRLTALWGTNSRFSTKGIYNCGDTVTLNLQKSSSDVSETFTVLGICAQGGATSGLKGVEISITRNNAFVTSVKTGENGIAVVSGLAPNGQYSYSVRFGSQVTRGSFIPGGSPSVITTTVDCPDVTGATGSSGN
jgi:hypothetical protein